MLGGPEQGVDQQDRAEGGRQARRLGDRALDRRHHGDGADQVNAEQEGRDWGEGANPLARGFLLPFVVETSEVLEQEATKRKAVIGLRARHPELPPRDAHGRWIG